MKWLCTTCVFLLLRNPSKEVRKETLGSQRSPGSSKDHFDLNVKQLILFIPYCVELQSSRQKQRHQVHWCYVYIGMHILLSIPSTSEVEWIMYWYWLWLQTSLWYNCDRNMYASIDNICIIINKESTKTPLFSRYFIIYIKHVLIKEGRNIFFQHILHHKLAASRKASNFVQFSTAWLTNTGQLSQSCHNVYIIERLSPSWNVVAPGLFKWKLASGDPFNNLGGANWNICITLHILLPRHFAQLSNSQLFHLKKEASGWTSKTFCFLLLNIPDYGQKFYKKHKNWCANLYRQVF